MLRGSVAMPRGSVLMLRGSVVMVRGSVVMLRGSLLQATPLSVLLVLTRGPVCSGWQLTALLYVLAVPLLFPELELGVVDIHI